MLLRTTLLGKGVRALMQSPTGAQLVGIDTERLHPLMFGVGLGLSGVAGCLLSMTYAISPSMGEPYTVTALIVITLGGFGSMAGALVGGLAARRDRGARHALHEPVAEDRCCRTACSSRVLLWRPNGLFVRDEAATAARDLLVLFALAGWALALPLLGSEFVVSLALTCLMYVGAGVELGAVLRQPRATCRSRPRRSSASAPTRSALVARARCPGRRRSRSAR